MLKEVPAPETEPPDLLVVDLDLPGSLEGATAWRAAHPEARVVGFAFHVEEELIAAARAAGIEVVPHGNGPPRPHLLVRRLQGGGP